MNQQNEPQIGLDQLRSMMAAAGARRLLMKELAPNDNAKNQPYLSGSMDVMNIVPAGEVYVDVTDKGNRIMKAPLSLEWLQPDGSTVPAKHAKLILYPQYPEVRFSGFLRGSKGPSDLLTTRAAGRLMFFGITDDRRIIAWACWGNSHLAREIQDLGDLEPQGVFRRVPLLHTIAKDSRTTLLDELRRIHLLNWITGKRRTKAGVVPYNARNGLGYTLEAELGITNNGTAGPDFEGWEVKSNQVNNYLKIPPSKKTTLLTPEPDGGEYRSIDLKEFVGRYGYSDKSGIPDRMNFGGDFRIGRRHKLTGLTAHLTGFDAVANNVTDVDGKLILATDAGVEVATWSFPKLLTHWNEKHAKAVYVPGEKRETHVREYRYGSAVYLCEGTDFSMFLAAVARGLIFVDPGIKVENISSAKPTTKKRSQFRINFKNIPNVYHSVSRQELL